ncbi:MAG: iron ABC transporter permease [Verrucomicrobia bacterium]|nr:iron ABC transporter permease [Verrucomicrobiota bacterium]
MSRAFAIAVGVMAALFFGCFFLWPILQTVQGAFRDAGGNWTLDYLWEIGRNRVYLEGLQNAFFLALASTALTIAVAVPLAWLADRFDFPAKRALLALLLVPMVLPPFVGAIGLKQILGQYGALNALLTHWGMLNHGATIDWLGGSRNGRFWGVVVMNTLHLYPILFLNVAAALANIDPAMGEAAENLGCTGWRKFRRITLPLMMPGLFAGGAIVFIWAFTELGVPLMFDYNRVTPVQIFHGLKELAGNPLPYALVVVTLVAAIAFYAAGKWAVGGKAFAMLPKATRAAQTRQLGPWPGALCTLAFAGVIALALLPHAGVVLVSFARDWYQSVLPTQWTLAHYQAALGHDLTVPSILNSVKYAGVATMADLLLGIGIAYVVVRTTLPGRGLLDLFAMLPLAVPGLVLAFGYLAMTQEGRVFEFLNPTKDPTALLIIAYSMRRLPYVVRSIAAGLQQTSVTLEEAAQNLGAPPLRAMRKITLPLISANLLAGSLLAFAFAMLEVSDSLILAQRQSDFPITKAIYELFNLLGEGRYLACALGVWAMVFLGIALYGASRILGKKLGALFGGN